MPVLGADNPEDEGSKPVPIQSLIDQVHSFIDEDEDAPQITQADLIRNQVMQCIECHPFDELILTAQHGYVKISNLDINKHRLITFDQCSHHITPGGNKHNGFQITEIHNRYYQGELLILNTPHGSTRVTPNHWITARFKYSSNLSMVYLMRKDNFWRIGKAKMFRGSKYRSWNGIKNRLLEETADSLWILGIYPDPKTALFQEQLLQARYGLPGLVFVPSNYPHQQAIRNTDDEVKSFYSQLDTESAAKRLLSDFNLDISLPFHYQGYSNRHSPIVGFPIRAINLISEYMEIPTYNTKYSYNGKNSVNPEWCSFTITKIPYEGLVYNLEVPPYNHYIANGVIVHNCKSVIPDAQVENNVFYQSGSPMPCPFCGGVCAVVPEALASTEYFRNRLDQMRGIGMTGHIPGVTAD